MAKTLADLVTSALGGLQGLKVYRDEPVDRQKTRFPYLVVREGIAESRDRAASREFDFRRELVQLDIWQRRDRGAEDLSLKPSVIRLLQALNTQGLEGNAGDVYRFLVEGGVRRVTRLDQGNRLVHDALTVRVTRRV